ncbi:hypothetical protein NYV43_00505 [Escherichia coli]|nr:hypothetical protein [Escherichia coli]
MADNRKCSFIFIRNEMQLIGWLTGFLKIASERTWSGNAGHDVVWCCIDEAG